MKICLDPGHYGDDYNPGVAAGYVESNFTWDYFWLLKERLERYGVEVICTRKSKDDYPKNSKGKEDLQARGKMSEGCDLFISIHSNAAVNEDETINPIPNGVFCHWSVRSGGKEIAETIGYALTDFFKKEWGKIDAPSIYSVESKKHPGYDYYGVLKGAASVGTPAIIVEHSFHTNPKYCEWAMIPHNIEKMADAEVEAIAKYYNLSVVINDSYFIQLPVNLKKGDKGEAVKQMQIRFRQINAEFDLEVKNHSFNPDGHPDGSFGGNMVKTVKKFQSYVGLPESGELDTATRMVLNNTVIDYSNRVTELIQEMSEQKEAYEGQLLETEHALREANVKIEAAIHTLSK